MGEKDKSLGEKSKEGMATFSRICASKITLAVQKIQLPCLHGLILSWCSFAELCVVQCQSTPTKDAACEF